MGHGLSSSPPHPSTSTFKVNVGVNLLAVGGGVGCLPFWPPRIISFGKGLEWEWRGGGCMGGGKLARSAPESTVKCLIIFFRGGGEGSGQLFLCPPKVTPRSPYSYVRDGVWYERPWSRLRPRPGISRL